MSEHWYSGVENDVKNHKKEIVMVLGTLVLVVFAYLAWRKSKGGGSQVPASNTSGVTDQVGDPLDQTGQALANAIKAQTGILDLLNKRLHTANRKLRNLNKKEHHEVKQNRHMEQQLHKLIHAQAPHKTHPTTKHGHKPGHAKPVQIATAPKI